MRGDGKIKFESRAAALAIVSELFKFSTPHSVDFDDAGCPTITVEPRYEDLVRGVAASWGTVVA